MPTAPSTIFCARRDDGARLLALEHRAGDLGRVGQVADARLDDLDARLSRGGPGSRSLSLPDLVRVAAQRHLVFLVGVVGVVGRQSRSADSLCTWTKFS